MEWTTFSYPLLIKEIYLDIYGHVNNATYLTLFEEARWDFITKNDYGLQKIQETGRGPVMLEIKICYLKELKARDEVVIESRMLSYENKIGKIEQKMIRSGEVCSTFELIFALFDLKERKLIFPTPEWLKAIGAKQ